MIYQTLLLFIGVLTGALAVWVVYAGFKYKDMEDKEGDKVSFMRRGLVARQRHAKNRNLNKIVELLKEKGELANADIRDELGVSARTIVNYMDELESEGVVEQIGDTGRDAKYKLVDI